MLVVKVGGSAGIDLAAVCDDVARHVLAGTRLILVHGGSHETNVVAEKLGVPPRFVTSVSGFQSRYTDRATLEIFEMVYCGKTNKAIVEMLQARGVNALGLSGLDGALLTGVRKGTLKVIEGGKRKLLRGDFTGKVERVNVALLDLLLAHGYTPVVTPPALSYEGEAMNVDGDRAAAVIAQQMKAECLVILSNVPGLLRDVHDEGSLIRTIPAAAVEDYMGVAQGRMRMKVLGASEAIAGGVGAVLFADARVPQPLTRALAGQGTKIA
ncbi:MAG: [LysW]-aminoadipate kinase [Candidatus Tectomicrobia bacterium]|nr:[LysW]-aminoadipate kinase [Candidatus Tectomicrobia bacterium]